MSTDRILSRFYRTGISWNLVDRFSGSVAAATNEINLVVVNSVFYTVRVYEPARVFPARTDVLVSGMNLTAAGGGGEAPEVSGRAGKKEHDRSMS